MGRVYVGSLTFRVFSGDTPTPGFLHRIDLDGTIHTVAEGILLSNGIAFSADGRLLYHADARADVVRVYDVHPDGALGPWRPFATFGGDDLRDLYAVTGSKGGPSDRCGSIYRIRSDVSGVPMHAAKVRV
jgi:gluconolactonase